MSYNIDFINIIYDNNMTVYQKSLEYFSISLNMNTKFSGGNFIHINTKCYDHNLPLRWKHYQSNNIQQVLVNNNCNGISYLVGQIYSYIYYSMTQASSIKYLTIDGKTVSISNFLVSNMSVIGKVTAQYIGLIPVHVLTDYSTFINNTSVINNIFKNNFNNIIINATLIDDTTYNIHDIINNHLHDIMKTIPNYDLIKDLKIVVKGGYVDNNYIFNTFQFNKNDVSISDFIYRENLSHIRNNSKELGFILK